MGNYLIYFAFGELSGGRKICQWHISVEARQLCGLVQVVAELMLRHCRILGVYVCLGKVDLIELINRFEEEYAK